MKLTAQNNTAFTDMNKLNMKPTAQSNNRELMWHEAKSNMELMNMIKEEINNQRKNVEKGVSHSDTLWTKTATSDADALSLTAIDGRRNPQDCSGQVNMAEKEDTNMIVLLGDSKSKKLCERHDAYYDDKKDIWLEGTCDNKDCEFCSDRPTKPSQCKPNRN